MENLSVNISFMCNCDLCTNMYPREDMIFCPHCEKLVCPKCWDAEILKCRDCEK